MSGREVRLKPLSAVGLAGPVAFPDGFFLIAGGALAALGGSPHDAIAGLAIVGSGVLIYRDDPWGVRAFAIASSKMLWKARFPAGAQQTPMTYRGRDGRQYVVVTAGGRGALGTRYGDHTLAFVLPRGT
jgi:glucose dehydrogenase